ncbi:D-tagatose-bisphosphate aldolase, class II, non-catalytic subunit [Breoghania sp.]|uniref:D-tagatose-bisphosphate aldolase, class II, non-catalytic subunit n=1 Tax=Breoghania sp. TaxID=2065378 RepID=UPI002AA6FA45|nr:D-tagatose-bisphosphate aldolase, class II, non-catalytic subunit [Breoghania sp.]
MPTNILHDLSDWRGRDGASGIPSICTAHPQVLVAAMRATAPTGLPLLVEATCNQVNQDGGYTGMTPADYRDLVFGLADSAGFDRSRLILAGDHLGPNPWKALPADEAMAKAEGMIAAFAAAGFTKLHLDCSMGCKGEPVALSDDETAERAARLAEVAEANLPGGDVPAPVYIIGTEVPVPGGATEELDELELTDPEAAKTTRKIHEAAFGARGLSDAFSRVVGLVVQPGVEYGNHNVIDYDSAKAQALSAALADMPGLVFEAHSTDYQTRANLRALVHDGFAILKVGPGLTFRWREALYGLDIIASELFPGAREKTLRQAMEEVMLADPANWDRYYEGDETERAMMRHFSYSDRIRYYWPAPAAQEAERALFALLDGVEIPEPLISAYLGARYADVRAGRLAPKARELALAAVEDLVDDYIFACRD